MQEYNDAGNSSIWGTPNNNHTSDEPNTPTLAAELDACQLQLQEWKNKFFYVSADFENYKKRTAVDRLALIHTTQTECVRKLLPVIDGMERALLTPEHLPSSNTTIEGMRMLYQAFQHFLKEVGVEEVATTGKFNPELHEALSHIADPLFTSGDIIQVLQKGYMLKDILIRPALVSVAQ